MMKLFNTKSSIEDVDEKGIVKIRVSAFGNIDSYGDIMDSKAFNKSIADFNASGKTRVKHLKNHNWNQAIGVPVEMTVSSKGLDVVSKINLEKQLGKETFSDYKFYAENNQTLEHSIGYVTVKEEKSQEQKANILKEVNLMEYSTLDFLGANSETPLLDLKSVNMTPEELIKRIEELEARLKALEPSEDTQAVEEKAEDELIQLNKVIEKLNLK